MQIYQIVSTIKIIIWILSISLVWIRTSPLEDVNTWVIFMIIWAFLTIRWISFWILYLSYLILSHKKLAIIASQSYKISFLIWIYWLINLTMIAYEIRNIAIWLSIAWFFIWIAILMFRSLNYKFDIIWSASTISSQDI